jgi:ubiquinone biosynthesis protein UbiJ
MPEYRTPLPGILAAMLETAINRLLELDRESSVRLARLDGRMLQLDIEGIGITLYFAFNGPHVEVGTRSEYEADTVISGSPYALFSMAVPEGGGGWSSPDSRVRITGDATLARDLERLFSQLEPDWEGRLARIFGDVWGHQVAAGLRAGAAQARETAESTGEMISEDLQGEQAPLVRADEIGEFNQAVEEVREDFELLQRRIAELEKKS